MRRAEASGYRALCLTVDAPVSGVRNREARAKVQLPSLPNLSGLKATVSGGSYRTDGRQIYSAILDPALSWKDLEWLCSFAKVPVLVKGVLNPDDADRAVKAGGAGIIVSNHGGRMPVLLDGGIRRGTDVLKAIALGANATLIGRPYLYGLGAAGETGVTSVLKILQREFEMAMALTGRTSIKGIDRSVLWT